MLRALQQPAVSPMPPIGHDAALPVGMGHRTSGFQPRPSKASGGAAPSLLTTLICAAVMATVMTIFSGYTVLMKGAISHGSNPLVLGLLRECLALCVLLPYAYLRELRLGDAGKFWVAKDDVGSFIVLGLLMIWCVQLLSALSLNFISASQYALFSPSVPVFCLLVSWLGGTEVFHRRLQSSWLKTFAIVVTLGGAVFIAGMNYSPKGAAAKSPLIGFAYLLVNKMAVGAYPVFQRSLLAKYPSHVVVAWGYAAGALLTLMSAATCATDAEAWAIAPSGWAAVVYSALLSSALNYLLMAWVNKSVSPLFVMGAFGLPRSPCSLPSTDTAYTRTPPPRPPLRRLLPAADGPYPLARHVSAGGALSFHGRRWRRFHHIWPRAADARKGGGGGGVPSCFCGGGGHRSPNVYQRRGGGARGGWWEQRVGSRPHSARGGGGGGGGGWRHCRSPRGGGSARPAVSSCRR